MPWHIGDHSECSGFAVIKDGDGSLAGCHETRSDAEAQMAALYASENGDEMKENTTTNAAGSWSTTADPTFDGSAGIAEDDLTYIKGAIHSALSEAIKKLPPDNRHVTVIWTRDTGETRVLSTVWPSEAYATESDQAELHESAHAVALEEQAGAGPRDPLRLTFRLIKPGFGNSADGHYYSADVLKAAAPLFQGAKMYASDHRPEERSVLTEVAVIDKVIRFDTDGAPIALATIFDPTFAESTRNRAKAGLLGTLECSILGQGKAKQGKVGEREANIVESITAIHSVDLVSRAGAGGRALEIAESDSGGENVTEKETKIEEVADEAKTVTLREDENDAETEQPTEPTAQDDTEPEATTEDEPEAEDKEEETDEQPVLSAESVTGLLAESGLGTDAINLLAARPYQTEQEVTAAIGEMTAMIKRLTGSGQPFAQGNTAPTAATPRTPQQEVESYRAIKEKWGLTYDYKVEE